MIARPRPWKAHVAGLAASLALMTFATASFAQREVPMTPDPEPAAQRTAERTPMAKRRYSTSMMVTGISLIATGVVQIPVGVLVVVATKEREIIFAETASIAT